MYCPILVLCVVLLTMSGVGALAQGTPPDITTPPVVYAFGISATTMPTVGCPGNAALLVQTKATDVNGVPEVDMEFKRPGDVAWAEIPMELKADGYWRAWIPKAAFVVTGIWQIRVEAYDGYGNSTIAGPKSLTVAMCVVDTTLPTVNGVSDTPDPIYAMWCKATTKPKTTLIQANVWDASGIDRVQVRYLTPGAGTWTITPMTRYIGNTYRATIGPFSSIGLMPYRIYAWDKFGNRRIWEMGTVLIQPCNPI